MNAEPHSKSEAGRARRQYARLVNLYPAAFRERYAAEMLRIFDQDWNRLTDQGDAARRRYGRHMVWDALRTLPREYLAAASKYQRFGLCAAAIAVLGFGGVAIADGAWPTLGSVAVLVAVCATFAAAVRRMGPVALYVLMAGWGPLGYGVGRFLIGNRELLEYRPIENTLSVLVILSSGLVLTGVWGRPFSGFKAAAGVIGVCAAFLGLGFGEIGHEAMLCTSQFVYSGVVCVGFVRQIWLKTDPRTWLERLN